MIVGGDGRPASATKEDAQAILEAWERAAPGRRMVLAVFIDTQEPRPGMPPGAATQSVVQYPPGTELEGVLNLLGAAHRIASAIQAAVASRRGPRRIDDA